MSVWQHVKLSEQIRPWDTLACCWDVKQPSNKQPEIKFLYLTSARHRHDSDTIQILQTETVLSKSIKHETTPTRHKNEFRHRLETHLWCMKRFVLVLDTFHGLYERTLTYQTEVGASHPADCDEIPVAEDRAVVTILLTQQQSCLVRWLNAWGDGKTPCLRCTFRLLNVRDLLLTCTWFAHDCVLATWECSRQFVV